jgi:hypothetical protein
LDAPTWFWSKIGGRLPIAPAASTNGGWREVALTSLEPSAHDLVQGGSIRLHPLLEPVLLRVEATLPEIHRGKG